MRIVDRDRDSLSLDLNLDRTAFWLTVHGSTKDQNRVLALSVKEAKSFAHALLHRAAELERQTRRPVLTAEWPFPERLRYAVNGIR